MSRFRLQAVAVLFGVFLMGGCATNESIVDLPRVSLNDVELMKAGFDGQTFLLRFGVDNPNLFPLPVTLVRYQIHLADQKFASGEVSSAFSIPAAGNGDFDLRVELDLLKQASGLIAVVRSGMRHHVEYELHGSLSVDIPLVKPIPFSSTGSVQIRGHRF